ncbi:hypothetical protein Zmor_019769 [Zophobas morio]|uniref:Gustatory receptor n=1 Tax=Zophobas morio TaxID=2755281 RepID=A0AA38I0G7_9CUCU|nr:hypothetical protein Zmor_019769 [Zophobas morio]
MKLQPTTKDILFLRHLCTYLDYFLITPWYDFNQNEAKNVTVKKICGCVFVATKLVWVAFSALDHNLHKFYAKALISQQLMYAFIGACVIFLLILTVCRSSFLGVDNWKTILTNLDKFDTKIKIKEMTMSKSFVYAFVLQQVMYFTLVGYLMYLTCKILGVPILKALCLTLLVDVYYELMTIVLAMSLNDNIRRRYK